MVLRQKPVVLGKHSWGVRMTQILQGRAWTPGIVWFLSFSPTERNHRVVLFLFFVCLFVALKASKAENLEERKLKRGLFFGRSTAVGKLFDSRATMGS